VLETHPLRVLCRHCLCWRQPTLTVMRWLRLGCALSVAALLLWAALYERHQVGVFAAGEPRTVPGMALAVGPDADPWWPASFTEAATVEAFISQDGVLLNTHTLSPGQVQLKDCKT
jgi:hypothetical protein